MSEEKLQRIEDRGSILFGNMNIHKNYFFFKHDAKEALKVVEILNKKGKEYTESETRMIYFLLAFSLECYLKSALILEKNLSLNYIKKYSHDLMTQYKDIIFLKLDENSEELIQDLNNKYKDDKTLSYTATLVEKNNNNNSKFYPVDDYLNLLSQIEKGILEEEKSKSSNVKKRLDNRINILQ